MDESIDKYFVGEVIHGISRPSPKGAKFTLENLSPPPHVNYYLCKEGDEFPILTPTIGALASLIVQLCGKDFRERLIYDNPSNEWFKTGKMSYWSIEYSKVDPKRVESAVEILIKKDVI